MTSFAQVGHFLSQLEWEENPPSPEVEFQGVLLIDCLLIDTGLPEDEFKQHLLESEKQISFQAEGLYQGFLDLVQPAAPA